MPYHVLCPDQLHRGLAETAVGEDRGPPLADSPLDKRLLKVEQEIWNPGRIKPVVTPELSLAV